MKFALALLALAAPTLVHAQAAPAAAASNVTLKSETFIARTVTDEKGQKVNKLFPVSKVLPRDVLLFQLSYQNLGKAPAAKFVINNPIPDGVDFTGTREPWAQVSIDGGKTFGALATLKVKLPTGVLRAAGPLDVTQIRWTFAQPIAPGAKGNVQFYAVVK